MEKGHLLGVAGSQPIQHHNRSHRRSLFITVLLCAFAIINLYNRLRPIISDNELIIADNLGELIPTECWSKSIEPPYKCYYLHAPLDHLNASDPRTARLAVVTYSAGGGTTPKKDILGTILLNPGGPGGSGVSFMTTRRPHFKNKTTAEALDRMMKGKYNFLSWDVSCRSYRHPSVPLLTLHFFIA